jgi:ABC-2 type transport system ATP-binding protein
VAQIEVRGLRKSFRAPLRSAGPFGALKDLLHRRTRTVEALKGITFEIDAGQIVGCIGPNGAGKSTAIKIIAGIMNPDGGEATVLGRTPWADRIAHVRHIGVVFGQRTQLWWDLPVIDSFALLREIYDVPRREYEQTLADVVERFKLAEVLDSPVRQLSLGLRMRCDLAAALLHRPSILFLDEPTIGLDAVSKLALREAIRDWSAERGLTVLLTTHDMDDIEDLCRRVLLIADGSLLLDGAIDDLRRMSSARRTLMIDLAAGVANVELEGAELVRREGDRLWLEYDPEQVATHELIARAAAAFPIRDLTVADRPIEEVVAQVYRDAP